MARRGVHGAGAGVRGDMVADDDRHLALLEGMPQQHTFERLTGGAGEHLGAVIQAIARQGRLTQAVGEDQQALRGTHQRVLEVRMQRHRLVGRQRPRRGGPDDYLNRAVDRGEVEAFREVGGVGDSESDVDRR